VSAVTIEINDAGIRISGETTGPSPGYALADGDELLTGEEALAVARLRPRQIHNRFWCELDDAPLGGPFPPKMTRADLAHAHLTDAWRRAGASARRAILAVPGSASEQQLGWILGLGRACGVPVAGMVDAALAAAASGFPGRRLLHLDLQLHRVVATELNQDDDELVRRRVQVSETTGIVALHDAWVRRIARVFVRNTRFDPLHGGATEQALYDRLPDVFAALRQADSSLLEIKGGGKLHAVELVRSELLSAVQDDYDGVVQLVRLLERDGESPTLLVSHRVDALPGLRARLGEIGDARLLVLPPDAVLVGALRHEGAICAEGEALPFVTRLPAPETRRTDDDEATAPPAEPPDRRRRGGVSPTHLLWSSRALPISDTPIRLGVAPSGDRALRLTGTTAGVSRAHCSVYRNETGVVVEDHSTHGSFVNEQRIHGRARLFAGDRLRLGTPGIELSLIRVEEDDGPAQD
jgi:hypothetical protein